MEKYELKGIYPDNSRFHAYCEVEDQRDAIAIAQGIRKVTTIRKIALYAEEDDRCVYYDELRTNW